MTDTWQYQCPCGSPPFPHTLGVWGCPDCCGDTGPAVTITGPYRVTRKRPGQDWAPFALGAMLAGFPEFPNRTQGVAALHRFRDLARTFQPDWELRLEFQTSDGSWVFRPEQPAWVEA